MRPVILDQNVTAEESDSGADNADFNSPGVLSPDSICPPSLQSRWWGCRSGIGAVDLAGARW
jgi:hypothetical protein